MLSFIYNAHTIVKKYLLILSLENKNEAKVVFQ
jgi:hypothetical protein